MKPQRKQSFFFGFKGHVLSCSTLLDLDVYIDVSSVVRIVGVFGVFLGSVTVCIADSENACMASLTWSHIQGTMLDTNTMMVGVGRLSS